MSPVARFSLLTLAAVAAVLANDVDAGLDIGDGLIDGALSANLPSVDAALITPLGAGEIAVDKKQRRELDLGIDAEPIVAGGIEIPVRHRRMRRQLAASPLDVANVFNTLSSTVSPILDSVTNTLADMTGDVEPIVDSVTADLGNLTSVLKNALSSLNGLTGTVRNRRSSSSQATSQQVAQLVSGVTSDVANTLKTVNDAVGSVPVLGPVLEKVTTEVESTMSSMLGVLSQVAAPAISILNGLLSPMEDVLNEVGLGSISGVVSGLLGSLKN